MTVLVGDRLELRPPEETDIVRLVEIRCTPEVHRWWRGDLGEMEREVREDFAEDSTSFVMTLDGRVVGWIQYSTEEEPAYRCASIDLYVDPAEHDRGLGTESLSILLCHLLDDLGHHHVTIDPAADNARAIRCYERVGFRRVGILRSHELGNDGAWHDSLLMDLLASDLVDHHRLVTQAHRLPQEHR